MDWQQYGWRVLGEQAKIALMPQPIKNLLLLRKFTRIMWLNVKHIHQDLFQWLVGKNKHRWKLGYVRPIKITISIHFFNMNFMSSKFVLHTCKIMLFKALEFQINHLKL